MNASARVGRKVETIGLVARRSAQLTPGVVRRVVEAAEERGLGVLADLETARHVGEDVDGLPPADLVGRVDLVVTLGGDGTLLAVARLVAEHGTPILGVNLGRLGFLTEVEPRELGRYLDGWRSGAFEADERMMLDAWIEGPGVQPAPVTVLNDAVLTKSVMGHMLEFTVEVDGDFVASYRADGLIAATPTGSTAYAMSAGGSILHPRADAILVNPICPHASSQRPFVVPGGSEVRVTVAREHDDALVSLDGQPAWRIPDGCRLVIRRSAHVTRIVHDPAKSFWALCRSKLGWANAHAR